MSDSTCFCLSFLVSEMELVEDLCALICVRGLAKTLVYSKNSKMLGVSGYFFLCFFQYDLVLDP